MAQRTSTSWYGANEAFIRLTFDDATFDVSLIEWDNSGTRNLHVELSQPPRPTITRDAPPGDSGNFPLQPGDYNLRNPSYQIMVSYG